MNMRTKINYLALFISSSLAASGATVSWDGGGVDDNWNTADNWSNNLVPSTGDVVTIGSAYTVNRAVSGGVSNITLNLDGTFNVVSGGVFRADGSTINVSSTGVLTGTATTRFYDFNNATVNFENGAQFIQGYWENKGTNVFKFELGSSGFSTLTPTFFNQGGGSTQADATYTVDMQYFTGSTGVITLVDFGSDVAAIDETEFAKATLSVINAGGYTANLQWNETDSAIELNVTAAVPEPSSTSLLGLAGFSMLLRRRRGC